MRLDKFLSAVRIFKSRNLAAEALSASMVYLDNLPAKASKSVTIGSIIEIDTPIFYKKIEVLNLPPKNLRKEEASSLIKILDERIKD
jgi:ribosome-associated heat shock protein Hsp15